MAETNRRVLLARRPSGMVDATTTGMAEEPVPRPGAGEALVRVRYLSIDPTIRTWMNDAPGYLPPIALGDVVRSPGVGEIIESNTERYAVGDVVYGMTGWQDYTIADGGTRVMQVIPPGVTPELALNLLGMNGMTAYFGLLDVGAMRPGDTVVVSGAAGATGCIVGQIAKLKGAGRVVGIAGTDAKCGWIVDELGFDAAVNYRDEDVAGRLRAECPKGIDLYFDNVGGEILDICLAQLAMHGRVVLCGAISQYNVARPVGPANYLNLLIKRGRMEGFIIIDYLDRMAEAQAEMFGWVVEGRIRSTEHVVEGLDRAPDALNLLFTGGNTGKVIVRL
ncbi:MAG TPA: NADP-dependent oxidoreductase [Acidimicrobiales bacterium]|nr:NADP-dependent oxidoreductase [Acidimicrobiales bacterium]